MLRTVLLVEDNEKLSDINRRVLEKHGYQVITATTIAGARERLANSSPDVILLDVLLPDGNGIDFCAEIREQTDARILFITSNSDQAGKLKGLITGGNDYITKPYKLEDLLARVAAVM